MRTGEDQERLTIDSYKNKVKLSKVKNNLNFSRLFLTFDNWL